MSGPLFRDRNPCGLTRTLAADAWARASTDRAHSDDTERRDIWRHKAGLDTNGHGLITHEPEEHL